MSAAVATDSVVESVSKEGESSTSSAPPTESLAASTAGTTHSTESTVKETTSTTETPSTLVEAGDGGQVSASSSAISNASNESSSPSVSRQRSSSRAKQKASRRRSASVLAKKQKAALAGRAPPKPITEKGEHALHCTWTMWFANTNSPQKSSGKWIDSQVALGSFSTVEEFWRLYSHVIRAKDLQTRENLSVFRGTTPPAWERYPEGGCWISKVCEHPDSILNRLWEELVFATIGEVFEDPGVVGVVVRHRPLKHSDVLAVWVDDNAIRFRVGEKLKSILHLQSNTQIDYKSHRQSLHDRSTYRSANTEHFIV